MKSNLIELVDEIESPYKWGVELKDLTSLKIGGSCQLFIEIERDFDLIKTINFLREKDYPFFLLGNGTNLLVSDEGFPGVILKLGDNYKNVDYYGVKGKSTVVKVGAAKLLPSLAVETAKKGLKGIEWGCGIPGTVGGACMMNAGAYGGEISQVVSNIEGIDINRGEKVLLGSDDLIFQYRGLNTGERELIVTTVWLNLKHSEVQLLLDKINNFTALRKDSQPKSPNAGSVFKNPPGDFAGRLLEECGMKGYKIGDIKFSEKHANFIVNENNGKALDAWKLIKTARQRVKDNFGYELFLELQVLGNFDFSS